MVYSEAPRGGGVHSGSRGFNQAGLGVVGFYRVREGSLGRALGSSGFAWVHSCAPMNHWSSRGFTRAGIDVVGFIRVRECSRGRVMARPLHSG